MATKQQARDWLFLINGLPFWTMLLYIRMSYDIVFLNITYGKPENVYQRVSLISEEDTETTYASS